MMNTEITTTQGKPNPLAALAIRVGCDPNELQDTLKKTVFKGASDAEFTALVVISNVYDLNPILKELYAFPAKGGGIVPVVGIDGWLKIINRQPNYDGMSVKVSEDGSEVTAKIYIKDRRNPVEITEYFSECSRGTEPWKTMPKRMLRHKGIIQAARVAFGISGIQDEDEARDSMRNVTPTDSAVRSEPINPFAGIEPPAVELAPEPTEQADPHPEPKTISPTGRQTKTRFKRNGTFKSIAEKSGGGRTWFDVTFGIDGKLVTFTTFSTTDAAALRETEKGTVMTLVVSTADKVNFALETFELLEEGGVI